MVIIQRHVTCNDAEQEDGVHHPLATLDKAPIPPILPHIAMVISLHVSALSHVSRCALYVCHLPALCRLIGSETASNCESLLDQLFS